jgi:hypothetical protein
MHTTENISTKQMVGQTVTKILISFSSFILFHCRIELKYPEREGVPAAPRWIRNIFFMHGCDPKGGITY